MQCSPNTCTKDVRVAEGEGSEHHRGQDEDRDDGGQVAEGQAINDVGRSAAVLARARQLETRKK